MTRPGEVGEGEGGGGGRGNVVDYPRLLPSAAGGETPNGNERV